MGQAMRPAPRERTATETDGVTAKPVALSAANSSNANNNANTNTATALRDDYFASKDNKLEHSYWGFMNDYARNPKTDVHFPYTSSRRRFNFPPPIPGLPSPSFPPSPAHADTLSGGMHARHHSAGVTAMVSPPSHRGTFATPRFGAQRRGHGTGSGRDHAAQSPLQSLLLDPHHQPSASGFGTTSPQALRPRVMDMGSLLAKPLRRSVVTERLQPNDNLTEEEDEDQDHPPLDLQSPQVRAAKSATTTAARTKQPPQTPHPSAVPSSRSATGELGSWKYEIDSSGHTSDDADGENELGILATGPLGLIRQFRKAQATEGGAEARF